MEIAVPLMILAVLVFLLALGLVSMECGYQLRNGRHETARPVIRHLLRGFAIVSMVLFAAGALIAVALIAVTIWLAAVWEGAAIRRVEDILSVVGVFGFVVLVAGFFVFLGRRMLDVADSVGAKLTVEEQDTLNRKLAFLAAVGGAIVAVFAIGAAITVGIALAGTVLSFLGLFGLLVLIVVASALGTLAGHHRRSRQARLLWLLTIAVRKGLSLPEEIEAHANALIPEYWSYRYQPWMILLLPYRRYCRRRLLRLAENLREGMPLADALSVRSRLALLSWFFYHRFISFENFWSFRSGLVPQTVIAAIRIGEETGTLGDALDEAAVRQTQQMQHPLGIPSAFCFFNYLWGIVLFMTSIIAFQMYYIVPKMKKIFWDFGTELPGITVALIKMSDIFVLYFYLLCIPFGFALYVFSVAARGHYFGWNELRTPWLVRWFPRTDTPEILRALRRVVQAGKPLSDGLTLLAAHHHRMPARARLEESCAAVDAGTDCWQSLSEVGFLNPRERALLQAAQRVGNLPWALEELADSMERRLRYRLFCCFEFLRPILLFVLAGAIGFVVVALFMPIMKLINDLP